MRVVSRMTIMKEIVSIPKKTDTILRALPGMETSTTVCGIKKMVESITTLKKEKLSNN